MSDPYIGEIKYVAFNYNPYSFALCNGQLMDQGQNQALFVLIGRTFGYTTSSNFALPNLCGRAVVGPGLAPNGSGTIDWELGETNGDEGVSLSLTQYPFHNHNISQLALTPTTGTPLSTMDFTPFAPNALCGVPASTANTTLHPSAISYAGSQSPTPHENRQPYLALNPCIALYGIYPEFP